MPSSPTRARPIQPSSPLRGHHGSRPSSVLREKGTSRSPSRPRPSSPKKHGHRGGGEREKVLGLLRRTGRQTPEMPDFVHGRLKHYGPGKVVQIYDQAMIIWMTLHMLIFLYLTYLTMFQIIMAADNSINQNLVRALLKMI